VRTVSVQLGNRSYAIKIAPGLLDQLGRECARLKLGARCAIITDINVGRRYAKAAFNALATAGFSPSLIVVPAGETAKSLKTVQTCYDLLAAHRLERKSFIVALGGGVVGDLAGFVAATYLRGVAFVQVPTTLLAQVDSSVGGKVGVNLRAGKNLVGAFYQPRLVLCDLDTLDTLPVREFRAGLAEVIKYGIICDAKLFTRLERDLPKLLRRESKTLAGVVARCCEIKAEVVGASGGAVSNGGYAQVFERRNPLGEDGRDGRVALCVDAAHFARAIIHVEVGGNELLLRLHFQRSRGPPHILWQLQLVRRGGELG